MTDQELSKELRAELEGRIIPFWLKAKDEEHGGYYGYIDDSLSVHKAAVKSCILTSRILYFFSECYALLGRKDLKDAADHAFIFLRDHCFDKVNGGLYWSVDAEGRKLDTTKHTYNQAFGVYALSTYARCTGNKEALDLAFSLFSIIETKCKDEGGYREEAREDWSPAPNDKLSENGVMATRTMNTLLHVAEGFAGLYEASHDKRVAAASTEIGRCWIDKVYNKEKHREEVFFDDAYHTLIDLTSFGHDIESSWLLDTAVALLDDEKLKTEVSAACQKMAHAVYEKAFISRSVINEDEGGNMDQSRIWWVQAEAMLGFMHAYEKEPDYTPFHDAVFAIWEYIKDYVIDKRPGSEWFWRVDTEGVHDKDKEIAGPWKCPYHNGRMCIRLIRRIEGL